MKGYDLLTVLTGSWLPVAVPISLGLPSPSARGITPFLCLAEVLCGFLLA